MGQQHRIGSWRELGHHGGAVVVSAGGVLVSATSIYAVASLLPEAVAEIGGDALYGWNMTVFLVAQVTGTALVARALARTGSAVAYAGGFGLFAAGSLACALSPVMVVMLVGRGVQGLGAGLLTGLGFAVIHSVLPQRLWGRGVAVVSAMFGVGNIVGPALGGAFAQFGAWRLVFAVLAAVALTMGALALRVLPARGPAREVAGLPIGSLVLAVAVAAVVGVAGLFSTMAITAAFVVVGLVLALGCAYDADLDRARARERARWPRSSCCRPGTGATRRSTRRATAAGATA